MRTSLELDCFDGNYSFRLSMAGIIAIETKCDAGIGEIYSRTLIGRYSHGDQSIGNPLEGRYRYTELIEIIRQGLIGGGSGQSDGQPIKVDEVKANHLISTYVTADGCPIGKTWELASSILFACVEGYEPQDAEPAEDLKKKADETEGMTGVK